MSYEFLTTNEAARLLGVSRSLVIQWIDSGDLKGFKLPGSSTRRVPRDAVVDFAGRHGIPLHRDGAGTRRILIVEDDEAYAKSLQQALSQFPGLEVETAANGFEAGKLAAEFQPAVMLIDIHLKDLDGRAVCASLRKDPLLGGVRIVAMSGFLREDEERRLLSQGFDAYLKKPFPIRSLLELVQAPAAPALHRAGDAGK